MEESKLAEGGSPKRAHTRARTRQEHRKSNILTRKQYRESLDSEIKTSKRSLSVDLQDAVDSVAPPMAPDELQML